VLTDGAAHAVDSSELAFKLAAVYPDAGPSVLEPIMTVEVTVPAEFQVRQGNPPFDQFQDLHSVRWMGG